MKRLSISLLLLLILLVQGVAADKNSVEVTVGNLKCRVIYYTPDIVRVVKTPVQNAPALEKSLVVTLDKQADLNLTVKDRGRNVSIASTKLTVTIDKNTGNVNFSTGSKELLREKRCSVEHIERGADQGKLRVSQTFSLDKDEAIYGLGTLQDGKLNRRGCKVYMEQSNLQDYQNVIQSVKGWGVFWDNYSPTNFDDDEDGMKFSSQVGKAIDYYFMYGGSADKVVGLIRQLSGEVPMFPLWSYGYMQSRERYKTQHELLEVVRKYRELHIPLDCIIQDWQYWGNNYLWNAMEFLSDDFNRAQQMIDEVHQRNARIMISIWASFGPQTKPYRELARKNRLFDFETWPQSGLTEWPPRKDYPSGVRVYDAFARDARQIYWNNLKRLYNMGIDAWWMDSTDPDCFNPTDEHYDRKVGDSDGTFRSMRNAFPLCTVGGIYDEQRKDDRGKRIFIMTRSSFAGQQRYASNMWTGDVASTWDMLRKQVPAGLNFSLTGNPNFNTDIGGFFCNAYNTSGMGSAPKNPQYQELYVRWMQYGLFTPVFRSHGADAPREIYQFGKAGEPIYDAIGGMIRFRYRLLPYLYTTAWQCTNGNDSYLRPLFADFADDKHVWDTADAFMFGQNILVAPIVHPQYTPEKILKLDEMSGWNRDNVDKGNGTSDATVNFLAPKSHTTYLPKGTAWYDFHTGKRYAGGKSITMTTDINSVPMFVRAGSILPLGPEMEYVGQKDWRELEIRIYPGANATFRLYEDEGDSYNYEKGAYSIIPFVWNDKDRTLTIAQREGNFKGMLIHRTFIIVMPDGTKKTLKYDGNATSLKM